MKKKAKKSIKYQLVSTTLYITLAIALFIVIICYTSFHHLLSNSLIESTSCNLQLIASSISSSISPAVNLANWCGSKNVISSYLLNNEDKNTTISNSAWQQLKEEYLNNTSSPYITRIVIGNDHKNYLHVTSSVTLNAFNMVEKINGLPYFDAFYSAKDLSWIGLVNDPFSDDMNNKILPIIKPIYSKYNTERIGWCYIGISSKALTHNLSRESVPDDSRLFLTINQKTYDLMDPNLSEVTAFQKALSITHRHNVTISKYRDAKGIAKTYVSIPCNIKGWYISQSLSNAELTHQNKLYTLLVGLIFILVLSLCFVFDLFLDHLFIAPLERLLHKIGLIAQGDFSMDPTIESDDELGNIGKSINGLSASVTELMDNRVKAEKEKKELEYQMLQSQINPHFLYNTLNSIKWMATIQKTTGVPEMTTALARLLRAISKNTQSVITLRDEIDLLDNYFLIQKYRYGGTITLSYEIASHTLYDCKIPKFTLQPIVENAIFHGIEPKGEAGTITVRIDHDKTNTLLIDITDNGVGMSDEQIDLLLNKQTQSSSDFFKQIGIHNVNQRIKYEFGSAYGLTITSEQGTYTKISIKLPYLT